VSGAAAVGGEGSLPVSGEALRALVKGAVARFRGQAWPLHLAEQAPAPAASVLLQLVQSAMTR
jgi:hypothetical protein